MQINCQPIGIIHDIKPYVDTFDSPPADRFGWLEKAREHSVSRSADDRFRK